MLETREKNKAFYIHEQTVIDSTTGQILKTVEKTISKTTAEPDFIKVYYETMMAFNQIYDIPVSFVLSLSKFIGWSNDGKPLMVTLNKMNKEIMCTDCEVSKAQLDRYIKKSVENGLLFRIPGYRGVYEVNPFMIAKGKWDSIRKLRSKFDFTNGKWERTMEVSTTDEQEHTDTRAIIS